MTRRVSKISVRALRVIFIVLLVAATLFPIHALIVASLESYRRYEDYYDYARWTLFPRRVTWFNYMALTQGEWAEGFRNSVIITLGNTALCLLLAVPASYIFTRARFRFDRWLFLWFLLNRVAPPGIFRVPFYVMYTTIGLHDTLLGVMIAHTVFNLPTAVWLLTGFMRDIPTTIDEQAFIDGHGTWGFWRRILLPQLLPAIGVTSFFLWMFSWTDVLLSSAVSLFNAFPFVLKISRPSMTSMRGPVDPRAAAAGVISIIPGLTVLFFIRRYIARGFTLGGVRE